MGETTDNLKTIAQMRKALEPLVSLVKRDTDGKLEKRLEAIESAIEMIAKKDTSVTVKPPEVVVNMPVEEIVKAIKSQNLHKSEPKPVSTFEPHDQAKAGAFQYSGFVRSDGDWYIQRVAKGEQRYAKGTGDYSESWETRTKLNYGYLDK